MQHRTIRENRTRCACKPVDLTSYYAVNTGIVRMKEIATARYRGLTSPYRSPGPIMTTVPKAQSSHGKRAHPQKCRPPFPLAAISSRPWLRPIDSLYVLPYPVIIYTEHTDKVQAVGDHVRKIVGLLGLGVIAVVLYQGLHVTCGKKEPGSGAAWFLTP
jgi:hypothetical protein